tara:strand:- start:1227 stop:1802 length:576 start_codon:yes stop_codon:yes gene_type:complete
MIRIGIIGDIGSGKTYVANSFGYPVFNADKEVETIYEKNYQCFRKLKKKFPKFIKSFPISKSEIANIIFFKKNNLRLVGKIVHPYVNKKLQIFLKKNNSKNVVLDIPLILENKIKIKKIIFIFIDSRKKDIKNVLNKRKNFNKKLYLIIKKNQLPLSFKKKKSDFIIKNEFNKIKIKKKIKFLKKKFKNYD